MISRRRSRGLSQLASGSSGGHRHELSACQAKATIEEKAAEKGTAEEKAAVERARKAEEDRTAAKATAAKAAAEAAEAALEKAEHGAQLVSRDA